MEQLRYLEKTEAGQLKFLVQLPGMDKGLELKCGPVVIDASPGQDPVEMATTAVTSIAREVASAIRPHLPITSKSTTTASLDAQAIRVGALLARWFYYYIELAYRQADAEQT